LNTLKDDFHKINNMLNKITILSGQKRYELQTKGLDMSKIDDEKEELIKLLDNLEDCGIEIGKALKELRKSLEVKNG